MTDKKEDYLQIALLLLGWIKKNISQAIKNVYSKKYQKNLKNIINPYYKNNTTLNIAKILKLINLKKISIKKFIDLNKNENKQ